ncbi:MAG: hypothetical protein AAF797_14215 [Planctomycetota bacterium]
MHRILTGVPTSIALTVLVMTGCCPAPDSGPAAAEEAQRYETTLVPIANGLAIMVVITDHEAGKTYLYKMPRRDEDPGELIATIDLATAGEPELGMIYEDRLSPATAPATQSR